MSEEFLSSQKAAAILKVAVSTVKRWTDEGLLPAPKPRGATGATASRISSGSRLCRVGSQMKFPCYLWENSMPYPWASSNWMTRATSFYSKGESKLSGYTAEEVMGRHFFTDVAPCTNNRLIYRPFQEGILNGVLNSGSKLHVHLRDATDQRSLAPLSTSRDANELASGLA